MTALRRRSDAGAILVSTLTKVVVTLAIVAVIGFDTLSVLTGQYRARNDALEAAQAGNDALHYSGSATAARSAVLSYAAKNGDTVLRQGPVPGRPNGWFVELRREARVVIASYVPKAKDYVVATASATVSDPIP